MALAMPDQLLGRPTLATLESTAFLALGFETVNGRTHRDPLGSFTLFLISQEARQALTRFTTSRSETCLVSPVTGVTAVSKDSCVAGSHIRQICRIFPCSVKDLQWTDVAASVPLGPSITMRGADTPFAFWNFQENTKTNRKPRNATLTL